MRRICGAANRALAQPCGMSGRSIVEAMESRLLMSAAVPHRALEKLDSNLIGAYEQFVANGSASLTFAPADAILHTDGDSVYLQAFANVGDIKPLTAAVVALKGKDVSVTGREVDALLPIADLGRLSGLSSLRFAEAAVYVTNTGSVTSQGDAAILGPGARAVYNVSGAGIKVGILSDSFNNNANAAVTDHYANDVASGDLPAGVQILSDSIPGTDEGRAMAQVIYDTAPGATFAFADGGSTVATAARSVAALASAGAKVIVDDLTYLTEPFFQDSVLAQEASAVAASGVTYISAAGNFGEDSYASTWSNGNNRAAGSIANQSGAPYFYGGTTFNFATSGPVNDMQSFTLAPGASIKISLQWDQPYFSVSGGSGCRNQVDAYVLNAAGTQIVGGSANYTVGADPIQFFQFTNSGTSSAGYNLMIASEAGYATPGQIKYIDFAGQATGWTYTTNSSTIFGHANAAGVESVGAVSYANTPVYGVNPPVLESYSSEGGTPILFNDSGVRLASPTTRQEPAVVAPDDVYTTFYGTGTPYPTFSGTSASAAAVAGVAALLTQANPTFQPSQIDSLINSNAIPMGTAPNFQSGYGLVQAISSAALNDGSVIGTVFSDNNGNGIQDGTEAGVGGVTVYIDSNNSGTLQAGDPTAVTNASGVYTFSNQPAGSVIIRAVTPAGYTPITTSQTVQITGANTSSGVNFGMFPITYSTNFNYSNYVLQADATKPANDDILINNVLTFSAARSLIPSLSFTFNANYSSMTVSFANGNPIPAGGLSETAKSNASGTSLIINGTSASDTANINYQTTTFDGSNILATNISSETVNGNGGNDTFTIAAAQPSIESLTFNGGTGSDTLTVNDILPSNGTTTTFNAGTNTLDHNTLNVNAGAFTFAGDPQSQSSNLTVNLGSVAGAAVKIRQASTLLFGNVVFAAGKLNSGINPRHLAGLNINAGTTAMLAVPASHKDRAVLVVSNLNISGGILDLNANDMITNGSIGAVTPLLASGYAGGLWNGTGIQSSAAAADTTHLTALGSMQSTGTAFDGISTTTAAVLIKYTYYGDTNLSGVVDGTDYTRIDNGILQTLTGWSNGDFDYSGVIDASDYTLIDNAFNTQGSSL